MLAKGVLGDQYARSILDYLRTGTFDADLLDAPYEVRAASELARSRIVSLKLAERAALLAAATRDESSARHRDHGDACLALK